MKHKRSKRDSFIQKLDRTAETNPLLWLPCVLMIALALAGEHIIEYAKAAYSHRGSDKTVKEIPQIERKPFALRTVAMSLAMALLFMIVPEFSLDSFAANDLLNEARAAYAEKLAEAIDNSEGYAFDVYDMDSDGIDELFIADDRYNCEVFTYSGNSIVSLGEICLDNDTVIFDGKYLFSSVDYDNNSIYIKNGNKLDCAMREYYTDDSDMPCYEVNGKAVEIEEFRKAIAALTSTKREPIGRRYSLESAAVEAVLGVDITDTSEQPSDDTDTHYHDYGRSWGIESYGHYLICSCGVGDSYSFNHFRDYGAVTRKPTTETEGEMTYFCLICGEFMETEAIPVLDEDEHEHNYKSLKYDNDEHWQECDCGDKTEIEAHEYGDGVTTLEPTETTAGTITYKCLKCDHSYTDTIPAKDHVHNYDSAWQSNKDGHWHECACGDKTETEAHKYDEGVITLKPTETTDGTIKYTCSVCNYSYTDTIPAKDHVHNYDSAWQSNKDGHWHECACGDKTEIKAHKYDEGVITLKPTETTAGTIKYTCSVCGYYYTEKLPAEDHEHNYGKTWYRNKNGHWRKCTVCGSVTPVISHKENSGVITVPATETSDGVKTYSCTDCGYVIRTEVIPKFGHIVHKFSSNWNYDSAYHWHECTVCGERSDTARHTEGNGTVTVEPTATTFGTRTYYCSVCGYAIRTETVPPTGDPNPSYPVYPAPSYPSVTYPTNTNNTNTQAAKEPYIYSNSSKSGWDAIISEIDFAPDGSAVKVNMNGVTELPKEVVSRIQNRNIYLELNIGSNVWTINGLDVTKPKTVNMRVSERSNKIPDSVMNSLYSELAAKEYSLYHSGDFGFKARLTVNVGKRYNNYYAALYHYNTKTKQLEFVDESLAVNRQVTFELTHASYYAVAFNSIPMYEDVSAGAGVFESSIPIETSAMPETSGVTIPAFKLPQVMKYSNKKRRYRILKKRRLDDLVFVF